MANFNTAVWSYGLSTIRGTFEVPAGAIPADPVMSGVDVISDTELRPNWGFVPNTLSFQIHRAPSLGGSYSLIDTITDAISYRNTGLTAETPYFYKIRAINDTGPSANFSNIMSGITAATLPLLTRIDNAIESIIGDLLIADGYFFDWGTVNEQDLAKVSKGSGFPSALIELDPEEDNIDDPDGNDAGAYQNIAHFKITALNKISKVTNPVMTYRTTQDKMLHDFKKAFGINYSLNGTALTIMYRNSNRINYQSGDIQMPGSIETFWDVNYSQDRQSPTQIGF